MYKNFTLTESEREDILNQHSSYGYKQPLNEQSSNIPNVISKIKVAGVIDSIKSSMTQDMWRDADDLMSMYKRLLPLKGRNVVPPGTELYAEMTAEEQAPMPALKYFNMMYGRIQNNRQGMGDLNFLQRLGKVGETTASGKEEFSKDGKFTTRQIKAMIYQLFEDAKRKV
jgi:hypothetical protein